MSSIPIFIISYNRGPMLLRVIDSYRKLSTDVEIVIHDNGRDDPETIEILANISASGTRVFHRPKINAPRELNRVSRSVTEYFRELGEQSDYVVTDCDIDLSATHSDALEVYMELLRSFPDATCVGPMLRIRDIPMEYPLFNRVMNRHIDQFWKHEPDWTETSYGKVAYQRARIDTTFALHRSGEAFRRLKSGLRVYEPFEALHLDWYKTDEDTNYHKTSNNRVAHWDNAAEFDRFKSAAIGFSSFKYVDYVDGVLSTIDQNI